MSAPYVAKSSLEKLLMSTISSPSLTPSSALLAGTNILEDSIAQQITSPSSVKDATVPKLNEKTSPALKFDEGKPDLSQISLELVEGLARVRMFGEKKYARDNWKKGFKITRSISACLRHIFKFLSGETNDSESGLCHLFHAVACLEHAIWDLKHNPDNDDRYKKENESKSKSGLEAWLPSSEETNDFYKCKCQSISNGVCYYSGHRSEK